MSTAKAYAYPASEMQARAQPDLAAATAISAARQARRLQHLVNNLPTAIIVLDERGYVAEANPIAISILGEPLVGQRWLDVIARSFRPRSDDGMEVSLLDGRRVKLAISSLEPEAGQLIVLTDLTETRQLQSRLAHLQRLSTLGKMMASLAHQIRTPLSSALLYAQNLASAKLNPQSRQLFQHKLVARLVDLEQQVNDMLLFARAGREQQVAALSLQQLLTEVFAGVEALVEQQQSHISVQLPEPDVQILGNTRSLAGAIQNLIQNSMQIIGQGAVLRLEARLHDTNPQQVVIAVEDNGPGVPEHLQQQIFEPFFTTRSQGTGLGLAVVQAVAHSHNGSIRYCPSALGGARFELLLPVYVPVSAGQELNDANN
ncbi:PAS domain-containing protein [Rheinheimera sediminis]|uniref:sensor histidine kinase n=1 Tax=Rheinheimera sp. YQF-1 TaxID=2499626 RepID=UPI000FDA771A|nr:ATP-binding protein [Rheinheimera sp. YQF-1]RVT46958.1 PAS domain-containing protein [Rheinheimera sp. YQF-1]